MEDPCDLAVRVEETRVGDGELLKELPCPVPGVFAVNAQKCDPLASFGHLLLEERELEAAGPAPGGPLVHDDGVPSEVGDLALECGRPPIENPGSCV